ncbi:MAG: Crp/Fnr family transcriptional regulator [Burkholderiales bacterium]
MTCNVEILKDVPLFSLLDEEELAVLATQVELRKFAARQRIYKIGDPSDHAYVMVSGSVQVSTIDEDNQNVLLDEPIKGDVFGFASMLARTPHQSEATASEETLCIELDLNDIATLINQKPDAGLDLMTVMGRQFHATESLVRLRAARNPNDLIEESQTFGERIADMVASFGGS